MTTYTKWEILPGGNVIFVPPSADVTGVTDADNIQAALTAGKHVILSGSYYIDTVLTVTAPAGIFGSPRALITFTGTTTTSPAITVNGTSAGAYASITGGRIFNIDLDCANLCRGMLFHDCWYTSPMIQAVTIRRARTLGLDIDTCYGSDIDSVAVLYCYGMSMRTTACNSVNYRNIRIAGAGLYWHANADLTPALWLYAGDNGLAAAKVYYGAENVVESWPAELAVADRAAVSILGATDLNLWENIFFEPVHCADYPALLTRSHTSTFKNMRFEGGHFYDSMVFVDGTDSGVRSGCNVLFDTVSITNISPAQYFVKLTNNTYGVEVRHLMAGATHLQTGIVSPVGAGHSSCVVTHSRAYDATGAYLLTTGASGDGYNIQGAPAVIVDGNTPITAANLQSKILQMVSSTATRLPTVPTGTAINAIIAINQSIDWSFINSGNQTVTITQATGHTLVGAMTIPAKSQVSFRTRCSAINTAITYALTSAALVFALGTAIIVMSRLGVLTSLVMADDTVWTTMSTPVFGAAGGTSRWPTSISYEGNHLLVTLTGGAVLDFIVDVYSGFMILTLDSVTGLESNKNTLYLWSFQVQSGADYPTTTYYPLQVCSLGGWSTAILAADPNVQNRYSGGEMWDQTSTVDASCATRTLTPAKIGVMVCPTADLATYTAAFKTAAGIPATLPKSSSHVGKSYLFAYEWDPDDWDDLLACATAGGFDTVLFHDAMIFETAGHYAVNTARWPGGLEDLAAAIGVFKTAGFRVGLHALFAGLDDADSYVAPTPDARLAVDATLTLAADIDADDDVIVTTATPSAWPANDAATGGATIWIDDELIQYTALDTVTPFGFTGCVRGYLGTTAAAHTAGAAVKHVPRHNSMLRYDVNTTILAAIATAVATVMDACDFDMIYLDGMENLQGGMYHHSYYAAKIIEAIYTAQANADLLVQCSSVWHYPYHLESRHASADGVTDFKGYVDTRAVRWTDAVRNMIPLDIGWYFVRADTAATIDEWEYVLCKCIGYDASFSLELQAAGYAAYSLLNDMLMLVKAYETLRLADVVDAAMKERLRYDATAGRREYTLKSAAGVVSFVRVIDGVEHPEETYIIAGAPVLELP